MGTGDDSPHRAWALFRYQVVAGLFVEPPARGELSAAIRELAQRDWPHPIEPHRAVRFGFSTIERWYHVARSTDDPIAALTRKVRADAGTERALSDELLGALQSQYTAWPEWSYQLHADNLCVIADAEPARYGRAPSYTTVRKAMKRRGWTKKPRPRNATRGQQQARTRRETRERRQYEASHVHALWHLDFHVGSRRVVDARGVWHTPRVLAILDDRSRVCCHLQWYLHEDAETLVHGYVQALLKRGLPRATMHDNGAAMRSAEFEGGLLRLGITPQRTLPYSPDQNGKQEDFWGVVEGRFLKMLRRVEPLTLELLNQYSAPWVEGDYNHRRHQAIGTTPIQRLLTEGDVGRPAPQHDLLVRAFTRRVTRRLRQSDHTVSIGGIRFQLPSRLRTVSRPTLRWRKWDRSVAWVVDPRTDEVVATVRPVDREANAAGRRAVLEPVEGAEPVDLDAPTGDPLPPLMKKLLEDYAATGLPAAYLPKDETDG